MADRRLLVSVTTLAVLVGCLSSGDAVAEPRVRVVRGINKGLMLVRHGAAQKAVWRVDQQSVRDRVRDTVTAIDRTTANKRTVRRTVGALERIETLRSELRPRGPWAAAKPLPETRAETRLLDQRAVGVAAGLGFGKAVAALLSTSRSSASAEATRGLLRSPVLGVQPERVNQTVRRSLRRVIKQMLRALDRVETSGGADAGALDRLAGLNQRLDRHARAARRIGDASVQVFGRTPAAKGLDGLQIWGMTLSGHTGLFQGTVTNLRTSTSASTRAYLIGAMRSELGDFRAALLKHD